MTHLSYQSNGFAFLGYAIDRHVRSNIIDIQTKVGLKRPEAVSSKDPIDSNGKFPEIYLGDFVFRIRRSDLANDIGLVPVISIFQQPIRTIHFFTYNGNHHVGPYLYEHDYDS